jgi:hypothetical protein
MDDPSILPTHPSRGPFLTWLGLGLAVLGVVAYVAQVSLRRLSWPWYMPALAIVGVGLVAIALREKRTAWRWLALLVLVLLTWSELALLHAMRLPAYAGAVAVGKPFPAFEAKLPNGTPFTHNDLAGGPDNVLVFFRGRW